jgi:hypothetical protein
MQALQLLDNKRAGEFGKGRLPPEYRTLAGDAGKIPPCNFFKHPGKFAQDAIAQIARRQAEWACTGRRLSPRRADLMLALCAGEQRISWGRITIPIHEARA